MNKATLFFADQSTVEIHEGDILVPIVGIGSPEQGASMSESVKVDEHIHNGLMPSIMDALAVADFFYLNHEYSVAYGSKAITKIVLS